MKLGTTSLVVALAASISFPVQAVTCVGDANGDGTVNIDDMLQILADWACATCPDSDLDGSGTVGIGDFLLVLADWNCSVNSGPLSPLSGTVTNMWTGAAIEGATVVVGAEQLVTDVQGMYSGEFAPGLYDLEYDAQYFNGHTESIVLFPNLATEVDVELEPVAAVIVNAIVPSGTDPGDVVEVVADVIVLDGSVITDYQWTQIAGTVIQIDNADTDTASVTFGNRADYKDELLHVLSEPPIGPDQLPPNVPPPLGEFPGGLQDRFQVVGINPFALEEAGLIALAVDVTTTSGIYWDEAEIDTHLPWKVAGGIQNVPLGATVLLYARDQASYDWMLADKPANSLSALQDATTRAPDFTPDMPGHYELTVTDLAAAETVTMSVYAGNWRGVIVGQDGDGRPVPDNSCTGCHTNLGFDNFTPWAQTGHAEILTDNLNNSSYYGPQCFKCHSVGYDPDVNNNGFDEAPDFQDFLASGLIGNPSPDNWTTMLADYPAAAQQANAQCENCHGPQWGFLGVGSLAHGPSLPVGEPRVSLSSDVCATCHGEPLRHARFQQWQLSAHANYEVAIDEGGSGSCSRCHTANGFLAWLPILLGDEPGDPTGSIPVTWTIDEVHPQTCVTCHDPHSTGTTSGIPTNATVRISGNTPPLIAGFTAYGVGRGAICMTCHNSRRGLRNDDTFAGHYGTSEATRAPHGSAQTDLLMGENAYLLQTGIRGNHSFVSDACVACHMEVTPPPDDLAYNQSGTNHTFYASPEVCVQCHGQAVDVDYIQGGVHDTLEILKAAIETALVDHIGEQTALGNMIDLDGDALITDVADVQSIEFTEFRGRQAMIITFTDQSVLGPYRMSDVDILDSGMTLVGGFYDIADPNLVRAGWNWALVHNDGSLGVHNPTYAYTVMTTALTALDPAGAAAVEWPSWLDDDVLAELVP